MIGSICRCLTGRAAIKLRRAILSEVVQQPKMCIHISARVFFDPIDYNEAKRRQMKKNVGSADKKAVVTHGHFFDSIPQDLRTQETFENAISLFKRRNVHMRGHVDFIYAALKRMKDFNVHDNLEMYKRLMDVFPKGPLKVHNQIQVYYQHYPRHQDCCMVLIDQMGFYFVDPDKEFYKMVEAVFGNESIVMVKMKSHMYWMPKFRYANPHWTPKRAPNSDLELAKIIVDRICRDPGNLTHTYFSESIPGAKEDTWLVSGQSPLQKDHILKHPKNEALYIDGPYRAWASRRHLYYFTLTAEPNRKKYFQDVRSEDHNWHTPEEWAKMDNKYTTEFPESRRQLMLTPTIHEQPDGTVLGVVISGSDSKESLAYWLMFLQKDNERLASIPVIFRISSPTGELVPIDGAQRMRSSANLMTEAVDDPTPNV